MDCYWAGCEDKAIVDYGFCGEIHQHYWQKTNCDEPKWGEYKDVQAQLPAPRNAQNGFSWLPTNTTQI